MLDTITYKSESKVVAVTKEIEKTISPDKVTEMYDAIREEVENSVVRAISIQDNVFKGVLVEFSANPMRNTKVLRGRFTLNGEEFLLKEDLEFVGELTEEQLANRLYTYYKEILANQLMKESIRPIMGIRKFTPQR